MGLIKKYSAAILFALAITYGYGQCSPDTTDPWIFSPPDLVLDNDPGFCSATITPAILSYPTVFDQCGISSTIPTGVPSGYTFPVGTTTVTWTVTDYSGNNATSTQQVTVIDNEPPQITCPGTVTVNTSPGNCNASVSVPLAIATDNCSIVSSSNDYTSGGLDASGTYPVGTTTVTFTVTDSANFTTTCSVDIIVVNVQQPVITLNGSNPITLEACSTYTELGASANDTCLGDISSSITIDDSALDLTAVGSYSVIYNVTNAAGVSANPVIRTVNVIDTTSPSLSLIGPNPLTVGNCSTYVELGASADDGCIGDISANVTFDNSSVDTSTLGSYTVTYWVTDNSGNSATPITRTINVIDNTPPDIVLTGNDTITMEACETYTELGATAIDPCLGIDYTSDLVIDTSALDVSATGSYTVSYNVTDNAGNVAIEVIRTIEVVDTTAPDLILLGDNPQTVSACTPYIELGATAIDPCFGTDYSGDIVIDTSSIDTSVEGTYPVTYTVCDANGNCSATITRDIQVVISNPVADAGTDISNSVCTDTTVSLSGNAVMGTTSSGLWTVTSGQTSGFSFSDASSPTSTFTGDIGEVYTLTWTIDNPDPCADVSDSIIVTFITCSTLDFDGVDDNVTFKDNFNPSPNFSLELWIKSETQNNNVQTIFSKREANDLTHGYDIRLVNGYISFNWNNGQSIVSPYQINLNQWHHVAVTFNGSLYTLYIDGIVMNTASGAMPTANSNDCLAGAMDQNINPPFKPVNYFDGGMDELRIWNSALTIDQIRFMMNQEIEDNAGSVFGSVVPINISGISWSNLVGYYQMNQSSDILSGNLLSNNGSSINGLLRYMTTNQAETAPLPYRTTSNGNWYNSGTWLYGNVQAIPNTVGIDGSTKIDWNIVKTLHNVSSGNNNITLLGLDVDSNTLTIENTNALDGQYLRVTDYLLINGILKLTGESQLLQDMGSLVDYTGTGALHRDQQGTTNLYNYNYWASPVSTDGNTYALENVLYDGLQPVLWTSAHNANPSTSPITLSNRWLYIYENYPNNSYADWNAINENNAITVGLGYSMKGSGALGSDQNYTFIGKPNNGSITSPIAANYQALVGNPFPSAIDAHEFILDNSSSILGTLYFWEHYASNATHVLEEYEGGYAAYNLSGGVAAVSPPEISGNGTPSKIPERYIPVAQGFFVQANGTGGSVLFENDQRFFVKEMVTGAADNGSVFFRNANPAMPNNESLIKRIRLNFITPEDAVRPLMLAFIPNNQATYGFDYGYDAINTETLPNDMSWDINGENYIIQGVGDFDETHFFPININLSTSGTIEIELTAIENFEESIDVYVYDSVLDSYTPINNFNYQETLDAGNYTNRFFITFTANNTLSVAENQLEQITVRYLMNPDEIYIKTPLGINTQKVELINLLGQTIQSWNVNNSGNELRLPIQRIAESHYVVKVQTDSGILSKKITVKF